MDLMDVELEEGDTDTNCYMKAGRQKERVRGAKRTKEPKTEGKMTKLKK